MIHSNTYSYQMRAFQGWKLIKAIALVLIALGASVASAQSQSQTPRAAVRGDAANLFSPVDLALSDFDTKQNDIIARASAMAVGEQARLVRVESQQINQPTLMLNLGPDVSLAAERTRLDQNPDSSMTWMGDLIDQEDARATFVINGDNVTGSVQTPDALFRVIPVGDGVHAIIEVDVSRLPQEHPEEFEGGVQLQEEPDGDLLDQPGPTEDSGPVEDSGADAQVVIDVMVAYTPAAKASTADIDGWITLAVAETNNGYANSDIDLALNLVLSHETIYTESGSFGTDLARIRTPGDGHMDEVQVERTASGADVVVLLIDNSLSCGLASTIMANAATSYAVAHYSCAVGYYSFGHEIGHLQGARHNEEMDPNLTPYAFGHGQFHDPANWRTIMAYSNPCTSCFRIDYWSNPDVDYGGVAMGTTTREDNARVLGETAATVAAFMPSIIPPPSLNIALVLNPDKRLKEGRTTNARATVTDSAGAGIAGKTVSFVIADTSLATVSPATAVTNGAGIAMTTVRGEVGSPQRETELVATVNGEDAKTTVRVPSLSFAGLLVLLAGFGWLLYRGPGTRRQ